MSAKERPKDVRQERAKAAAVELLEELVDEGAAWYENTMPKPTGMPRDVFAVLCVNQAKADLKMSIKRLVARCTERAGKEG